MSLRPAHAGCREPGKKFPGHGNFRETVTTVTTVTLLACACRVVEDPTQGRWRKSILVVWWPLGHPGALIFSNLARRVGGGENIRQLGLGDGWHEVNEVPDGSASCAQTGMPAAWQPPGICACMPGQRASAALLVRLSAVCGACGVCGDSGDSGVRLLRSRRAWRRRSDSPVRAKPRTPMPVVPSRSPGRIADRPLSRPHGLGG